MRNGDLSENLVTIQDPSSPASEDYRTLRTSLLYTLVDTPPKVVVTTSPGPTEGKSTICANLGVVLAQADKRTLILDCDLRKPTMHKIFRLRNFRGVVNIVAGEHDLVEIWQEPLPGLKVVTAGPKAPNPAELVGSRRFAELIDQARREFDYVLIDTPPTEVVSDPTVIAAQGEGVLLVLDFENTGKGALLRATRSLESVGAKILGTVVNNFEGQKGGYYRYTYGDTSDE